MTSKDTLTHRLAAACIGLAKQARLTEIIMTKEAFTTLRVDQQAKGFIEYRGNNRPYFGAIPVTVVDKLPDDAVNDDYVIRWVSYDEFDDYPDGEPEHRTYANENN